jgi:hypothetical protein
MALRPGRCRISLLTLNLRQLTERMFFAGRGKQDNREGNSDNA